MPITNTQSETRIDEIEAGIYRIHTPLRAATGGFSFNQYLVVDDEPLVFHTGPRGLFPVVSEAIATVLPLEQLRWIAFSHVEADEMGALNYFLAAAPQAQPLCSTIAAMVSITDLADRAPRAMQDGETMSIGRRTIRWLDTPHLPHGWETGYLFDENTRTLFCGDLFTQPGADHPPVTEEDILGPSEAFRLALDYYSHTTRVRPLMEKLAATAPQTLACMHGAAWRGNGGNALRELATALATEGQER